MFCICSRFHYSDVMMSTMAIKSSASRLLTQPLVQAKIKENIKAPRHWPLWWEFTGDRWIPRTKGQHRGNVSIWWRHHVGINRVDLIQYEPKFFRRFVLWCVLFTETESLSSTSPVTTRAVTWTTFLFQCCGYVSTFLTAVLLSEGYV